MGKLDPNAFEQWRQADPRHALAFARVADAAARTADAGLTDRESARVGRRDGVSRRVAVSVAVGAVSLGGATIFATRAGARDSASTAVGGRRQVDLPHAGALTLNTDSAATWRSENRRVRLWLERGEIALDLAAEAVPVHLKGGAGAARLAPGSYNARLRDGALDLTILRGEAWIDTPGGDVSAPGPRALLLTSDRPLPHTLSSEELAATVAWRRGEILFVDETLAGAVEEYNRHLLRKIIIVDRALGSLRVGGRFVADDPSAFLHGLEATMGVAVTTSSQAILLSRKAV